MEIDLKKLAETYLRSRHQRDEDFWAWEEVNGKVRSGDLDRAYDVTLLLLKAAITDDELGYVAAGKAATSTSTSKTPPRRRQGWM